MNSDYWQKIVERSSSSFSADNFEMATYRLVTEQILYHSDKHSRQAYILIEGHERHIQNALAPLGISLKIDRSKQYAYAMPTHGKSTAATVKQTLLALALLKIYDTAHGAGNFTAAGEVECNLVDLLETYRLLFSQDLVKTELNALMQVMKRWGIAKQIPISESTQNPDSVYSGQPYLVCIRPGIVDVLGETVLEKLILWSSSDTTAVCDQDEVDQEANNDDLDQIEDAI